MTIKQIQLLLTFLGYAPGDIDGVWGSKTKQAVWEFQSDYGIKADGYPGEQTYKALKHAVCYGLPEKVEEPVEVNEEKAPEENPTDVLDTGYPYFTLAEFKCPCKDPNCVGKSIKPTDALLRKLVDIRTRFGVPVSIESGVRCPSHNAAVDGVANSYHLSGRAADIYVRGVSTDKVLAYCSGLQLHYYYHISGSCNVHIDI